MQKKENVYEDTTPTGAGAKAQEGKETKDASAVLGKFKDVDALMKAYNSLEAEFTRRSQRLKELERYAENSGEAKEPEESLGAEKLRKTAESRREEEKKFDEFVKTVGRTESKEAVPESDLSEAAPKISSETGESCLAQGEKLSSATGTSEPTAEKEVLKKEEKVLKEGHTLVQEEGKGELFSSKEVYEKAMNDEEIRLKIIGEYLSSLGKSSAPITTGGSGILKAKPVKAVSITQAGELAAQYFKKETGK